MIQTWLIFAILGGIASSIYNFLIRYALKDGDSPTIFAWLFEVIRFVIFAVLILFEPPPVITPANALILFLVGLVELASIYTFMKMHSYSHLSISSIIIRLRLLWIPILAFFILGEVLRTREYIGILVLLAGITIVAAPHKLQHDRGMRFAYIFSFVAALLAVTMKVASNIFSPAIIMFAMSTPSVFILPFLMKGGAQKILSQIKENIGVKIGASLLNAGSFYVYIIALSLGSVSIVQSVYQGMMIFSVLAGIFFLKEREDILRKILGTLVVVSGIILASLLR